MSDADEKRQRANQQREASRTQVQRNFKLSREVSELLDTLQSDTGLPLGALVGEALEIAATELRKRHKPKK